MKKILLCLLAFLILNSCSRKIAFTTDVRKRLQTIDIKPDQLQYFTSNQITLRRQIDSSEVKVVSGVVKYENGKYVEEIIIKKGTPGVCDEILDESRIRVRFEEGEEKTLTFGDLNPSTTKYYILGSQEWRDYKSMTAYDGENYIIHTPYGIPYLLIKNKRELKQAKESRVAKGMKIK